MSFRYLDKQYNFRRHRRNKIRVLDMIYEIYHNQRIIENLKYGKHALYLFFGSLILILSIAGYRFTEYPEGKLFNLIEVNHNH